MNSLFELLIFIASNFKFIVELGDLVGRESEIFLGSSHFVSEGIILAHQLLNLKSVGFGLLVVGSDSALVLVQL